ncbi:MAG: hypothetical protein SW833_08470 [Cyanobacteriota bacterium]|nr:hypothetical protein [Cyanobacteriota bacterium]
MPTYLPPNRALFGFDSLESRLAATGATTYFRVMYDAIAFLVT